jgi:hypothetical protein
VGDRFIPHCRAQYGQWVGVEVLFMPFRVDRSCYVRDGSLLHMPHGDLPATPPPP